MKLSSNIYKSFQVREMTGTERRGGNARKEKRPPAATKKTMMFTSGEYDARVREIEENTRRHAESDITGKWEREYRGRIGQMERLVRDMVKAHNSIIDYYGGFLNSLTMEIVERIIRKEISVDPSLVCRVLKDALARVMKAERIEVKINPRDSESVGEALKEWKLGEKSTPSVRIVEDRGVARGGCRVESDVGGVDAMLQTQLGQFQKFVDETYENVRKTARTEDDR